MAEQPLVHRHVPQPPILAHCGRVPPVLIKLAVPKAQQLGQDVEPQMKERVEHAEPNVRVGQRQPQHALAE
eukprot:145951-Chlamydomonas_euryale.AAC.1